VDTPDAAAPTPTAPIRVFVVEDQTKILKNQLKLLEGSAEITIIGTALSGETGLEEVRRLKPDVLLLDLG
jgi:chemotaxis response regulator CheB